MDKNKVEAIVRPLIEGSGFELYDLDFFGRTLRVTINKAGGVTLEDCAETSRLLNPVLDVEDAVPGGRYELEVSSPGLNRQLKVKAHFVTAVGERIRVAVFRPLSEWNGTDVFFQNRKNIAGVLRQVSDEALTMEAEGRSVVVPLDAIARAQVDFELKPTPKKGKKG